MAKTCALCNANLSQCFPLSFELKNISICNNCHSTINMLRRADDLDDDARAQVLSYVEANWVHISNPEAKNYVEGIRDKFLDPQGASVRALDKRRKSEELKAQIIMTTTPSVEGYRIVEYCGLVFGETVFKSSFTTTLGKSIEDFGNSLNFVSTEMSGIVSLIEEAREYAIDKMLICTSQRGCNAIIAIDSESSELEGYIHTTIYGTAVKIEKL